MLAQFMQRGHIERVDIRALLAIHLDVHEQLVHEAGRLVVLEALMGHHMAPMTGGIAHRQQHGLVQSPRLGESGFSPGPPMHGIVLVLEEVGAGFFGKAIVGQGKLLRVAP
jgi:hypothetical protein